jgi:transposase
MYSKIAFASSSRVRQAEINAGLRPGVSESENAEIRRLKKEVTELKRANEIW